MAYITLEELKKILPSILDSWIDEDDESWEWIFNAIEQNCHVGKKKKDKKKWKANIESMVDTHSTVLSAHRNDINKLESLLKGNIDNVTQLGLTMKDLGAEIRRLRNEITAAKSMAEVAKNRTEVDYTKPNSSSIAPVSQLFYNRLKDRGATEEEIHDFKNMFIKYNLNSPRWEGKKCITCKFDGEFGCMYSGDMCDMKYEHWEAKDGSNRQTT